MMTFNKNKHNIPQYVKPSKVHNTKEEKHARMISYGRMAQKFYLTVRQVSIVARQAGTLTERGCSYPKIFSGCYEVQIQQKHCSTEIPKVKRDTAFLGTKYNLSVVS